MLLRTSVASLPEQGPDTDAALRIEWFAAAWPELDPDERAALRMLIEAVGAPMARIVANAGGEPAAVLATAERAGGPYGYDARSEQVVNLAEAGILDVAPVLKAAVRGAVTTAALALTIDVLVHLRKPLAQLTPR